MNVNCNKMSISTLIRHHFYAIYPLGMFAPFVTIADGWLDDLQFYILFNSISVISDNGQMIMKGCVHWNPIYGFTIAEKVEELLMETGE